MAENSKIEWCDHTVNFWWGCSKVSPACAHCYAEGQAARFHAGLWGPDGGRRIRVDAARKEALRYERRAVAEGRRFRVFTNSMSDFFEDRRDLDQARLEALDVIRQTPHLDWLILTKRPERILDLINRAWALSPLVRVDLIDWLHRWECGGAPANVWLGTTVEDQERADQRIPALLQVPAAVRFLSCEPLLGPVDLRCVSPYHNPGGGRLGMDALAPDAMHLDWVICGGESGPHARPMHPDWARGLRDQCAAAGVPFLFKQWGEWVPRGPESWGYPVVESVPRIRLTDAGGNGQDLGAEGGNDCWMNRAGKKRAGRLLDGVEHNGYPQVAKTSA